MTTAHTRFVRLTQSLLLARLAYAKPLPVGAWQNGFTRPDVLVLHEPILNRPQIPGRVTFQGYYPQAYMVECKIEASDLEKAPYQLLLALVSFRGNGLLDFNHGGVRPALAIPTSLRDSMTSAGSFEVVSNIFRNLNFGLFVVDRVSRSIDVLLQPDSFKAG